MHEHGIESMGVLSAKLVTGSPRSADDQRDAALAAEHVAGHRHVVHDLVHGHDREVDCHQFGNGSQTRHCRPAGHADNSSLGDRCIDHPFFAESGKKTASDLE
jgi:hypothetical protein